MIRYLRLLLLPLSLLYGMVVILRNWLYNRGILKSTRFDIPVICVGNLVVGGSGKSPVTEYLVNLLGGYKIAILSRGYGRETKGFLYADDSATARSVGDEPLQFYHKFPGITVAVCEDRVYGIAQLQASHDVILLDDAFQHRRVNPGLSILLFDYHKLNTWQFILPAGDMREPFSGYHRADLLMVTKCPSVLSAEQKAVCTGKFDYPAQQNVFFSSIGYGNLVELTGKETRPLSTVGGKTVFLLTGIANPAPLLQELQARAAGVIHHDYPDHHRFSLQNLTKLVEDFNRHPDKEKIIVTTEKDAQRLFDVTFKELLLNLPVFYLPIKTVLEADRNKTFDQKLLTYVSDTARNRRIYQQKNE